jgi:Sulfotransferase family
VASDLGERLIFLISQPRSGSTLLQRMLGGHPAIGSLPEPWFMLPLLYASRSQGVASEYNARLAARGLRQFVASLGEGDEGVRAVRAAASTLYGGALRSSGKQLFLDKTPRYYLIIPELLETFPAAAFLFLVRDPLDVFSSLLQAHAGGDWTRFARIDLFNDLMVAPKAIEGAVSKPSAKKLLIRYEDLVEDPPAVISSISDMLDLTFDPAMLSYARDRSPDGSFGDRTSINEHDHPVTDHVSGWRRHLDTRWKRSLALSYIRDLGATTLSTLGYELSALEEELVSVGSLDRRTGRRWRLIGTPENERTWRGKLQLSAARSLHERGAAKTAMRAAYIAVIGRPPKPPSPSGVTR